MYYTMYNSKFWNVPQNRERYFVVGVRSDLNGDVEFPTEQHEYVPKLSSILETNVDEKYYIADDKAKVIIDDTYGYDGVSHCLKGAEGGSSKNFVVERTDKNLDT